MRFFWLCPTLHESALIRVQFYSNNLLSLRHGICILWYEAWNAIFIFFYKTVIIFCKTGGQFMYTYSSKWAHQAITYLSTTIMFLVAFTIFLISMLALVTCPAWLPYVVEKLVLQ